MNENTFEDQINEAVKITQEVSRNCQVSIEEMKNAFAKLSNSGLKVKYFGADPKSLTEVAKINQPWYIKVRKFFWNV